ncbi:MAG TPA: SulP family inorganic anion transporter [candidate division Zixibacteria bacterium]|nr:SulP family inorganic anion transporter [candidate division Zixibacteria bacterium]
MAKQFLNPKTIREDVMAGLVLGIESVPDGLAQGFLAFVNPIYGLYGYMMGTFSGAFFTSSVFMVVQATGAMSLVVASVPAIHNPITGSQSLFALSILTGVVMLVLGLLKLGSLIRFVPNAVMTGFVNAVALLIILGQLGDLTGYNPIGANKITQTIDIFRNLDKVDLQTLMVGLVTVFLIINLEKTRLKALGLVAAMMVASLLVPLFGWESVAQLQDIAEVPGSLPRPVIPELSLLPALILPALSLAFVGLVQGASITKSYVNPDGKYPDASGDFVGQGVANMASGFFQGMPVGGSFSATSLAANAGARSRFSNIFAGITMAVVIVLFGPAIGYIAMPAMAGLLIVIGFRTFKPKRVEMVWKTGPVQQLVMGITFFFCLIIPLQYAVLLGVAMSLLLFVLQQSNQITIKAWQRTEGPYPIEVDPPETLPANEVVVLVPYGSLFFAAAPLFEEKLPDITYETYNTVVILNLRGYEDLGSTLLTVLERYTADLHRHESKLMLAGVDIKVVAQLEKTGLIKMIGIENVFMHSDHIGESILASWDKAEKWVADPSKRPVAEIVLGAQVEPEAES